MTAMLVAWGSGNENLPLRCLNRLTNPSSKKTNTYISVPNHYKKTDASCNYLWAFGLFPLGYTRRHSENLDE